MVKTNLTIYVKVTHASTNLVRRRNGPVASRRAHLATQRQQGGDDQTNPNYHHRDSTLYGSEDQKLSPQAQRPIWEGADDGSCHHRHSGLEGKEHEQTRARLNGRQATQQNKEASESPKALAPNLKQTIKIHKPNQHQKKTRNHYNTAPAATTGPNENPLLEENWISRR